MRPTSHWRIALLWLAPLLTASAVSGLHAFDDAATEPPDLPTLVANADGASPLGRPNNYKLAEPARFYVWHDQDGWHLRSTAPKGKTFGFRGHVRSHGATIVKVRPIGFDKRSDSAQLSMNRDAIEFKCLTSNSFDGFDFNVVPTADEPYIEFELYVGGRKSPKRVFIGGKAANPKTHHFALPADPK